MKHANTKFDPATKQFVFDRVKTLKNYEDAYLDGSIIRWRSNNQIPFDDMLHDFMLINLITVDQRMASSLLREREVAAFLDEYRRVNANREYTGEERFEMRAAFGEGAEVVNVFTGKRTRV